MAEEIKTPREEAPESRNFIHAFIEEDIAPGGQDSAAKRQKLLRKLDLPEHLTANGLLEALNLLYSRDQFLECVKKLLKNV